MKFLKRLFSDSEPLKIELREADEAFRDNKAEAIDEASNKGEKFQEEAEKKVQGLESVLDDIEGFQDDKGRKAVDDIAENLVSDRKNVIQSFSSKKDPEENLKEIREFMRDFQDLKRKEAAVLEITSKEKEIGGYMKQLEELSEEIEEFLDEEYSVVRDYEEIKEKLEKLEDLEEEKEKLEEKIGEIDLYEIEASLEEKRDEKARFRDGEEMEEYQELESRRDEMEQERKEIIESLESSMSKMKRGLKKLIYQAENSDLELENTDTLRSIRDQNTEEVLEKPAEVEKALQQLEDKGDISQTQRDKLLEGVSGLEDLTDKKEKIEQMKEGISEIESEIKNHSAPEKMEKLEEEVEVSEKTLEDRESRRQELKSGIEDLKSRREKLSQEIKTVFKSNFEREVNFET